MYGKFGGRLGLILLLLGLMVPSLRGQGPVVPAMQSLGEEPYGAYSLSATESVNLNNGNNNIVLTLASLKGRNGQDLSVTLSYNTKQIIKTNTGPSQYQYALAYTGWTQGQWVLNNWPQRTTYSTIQCLDSTHFQIKPYTLIRSPDGATHEMHPTTTDDWIGPYIYSGACPSSFIWPGPNPNYRSVTGTIMEFRDGATPNLYLKNGNRIDFTSLSAIKAVDTNGNLTTYNVQTSLGPLSVVDNLGRTINYTYTGNLLTQVTVTGANGQIQTYSFEYDTLHVNTQMQENCPAPCAYTLYHWTASEFSRHF